MNEEIIDQPVVRIMNQDEIVFQNETLQKSASKNTFNLNYTKRSIDDPDQVFKMASPESSGVLSFKRFTTSASAASRKVVNACALV